jgi:Domain of unknown function (DUF4389)
VAEVPVAAGVPPSAPPVPRAGDEILMAFAGPAGQRRVTVLFRLLLAIPQVIVLSVLSLVAEIVAIAGWFAALFTGRLPAGLAGFLTDWLRWSARAGSYLALLTDRYPPFEMADADYPVRVSVAPGRLNRPAVLFRIILAIPAALLVGLLGYGGIVVGFVAWLIVLITGTMPVPLYQAIAAVTRFGVRYYGYFFLLSGTYPGGLFGDPADPDPPAYAPPVDAPPTPPGDAPPGPATQVPAAAPVPAHWPADPQAWRLVLSGPAKRLVALFIAVGGVVFVGYAVLIGIAASHSASTTVVRVNAISTVSAAHSALLGQLNGLSQQISACQNSTAPSAALSCLTKLDRRAAVDIGSFANTVRSVPVPPSAATAAAQLTAAAGQLQSAFQRLGSATSVAQYAQIDSGTVAPKVTQFNDAYVRLGQALQAG